MPKYFSNLFSKILLFRFRKKTNINYRRGHRLQYYNHVAKIKAINFIIMILCMNTGYYITNRRAYISVLRAIENIKRYLILRDNNIRLLSITTNSKLLINSSFSRLRNLK
jgi:hypothetical protein